MHFAARLNRGAALRALGRNAEVLENDKTLVRCHPRHPMALYNLGDALLLNGEDEEALSVLAEALTLVPGAPQIRIAHCLALALCQRFAEAQGELDMLHRECPEAIRVYFDNAARAAGMAPGGSLPTHAQLLFAGIVLHRQLRCDWRKRTLLKRVLQDLSHSENLGHWDHSMAFNCLLVGLSEETCALIARQIGRCVTADTFRAVVHGPVAGRADGRLRVGYLSPDFREHPAAQCHWRQLQLHDRSRFDVFAYSLRDEGPSKARQRIIESADHFFELSGLEYQTIAQRIALDGIHILVDLTGYLDFACPEILAARPAPIQVQHMGTPGTSGAPFVDYRITDRVLNPAGSEVHWMEKLVYLPNTSFMADDTLPIASVPTREACGLPDRAMVFCCFNGHQKFEPESFTIWMRLLDAVPGSVLWLISGGSISRANVCHAAAQHGLDPARLIFAPRLSRHEDHLARYACADLFLDTFSYTAHVTALDAFWAGLPVLTCAGDQMAKRAGASVALAMGFPELVAADPLDYEACAVFLATHPEALRNLRQRVAAARASAPLFRVEERVRQLERAYETMWERHCRGEAPVSFFVSD